MRKVAEIWNERTSPMQATLAGSVLVMVSPRSVISPLDGCKNLVRRLKTVVLPCAVGADQRVNTSMFHIEVDILNCMPEEAARLAQSSCRQNGLAG